VEKVPLYMAALVVVTKISPPGGPGYRAGDGGGGRRGRAESIKDRGLTREVGPTLCTCTISVPVARAIDLGLIDIIDGET